MVRQKFIDRLRNKYAHGGETRTTKNLFGADVTKLNVPKDTPIEPSGTQKVLSFGAKAAKYVPAVARWGLSKALGPLSLLLGSNKAYAPNVIDPETGIDRYTGEQVYTPFQRQTGGMYDEPRQYHEGGTAEQDHIDMMNQGTLDAHNAEGNTGNTEGSMYGPNSENPGGPGMEWGAGWNMGGGGTGFGVKTPYGSFGMLPKAPKNWGEAGALLAGPAASLTGLAGKGIAAGQKLWDKVFQEGGMYNPQDSVVPWQGKHGGRPEYAEYHDLPQEEYDQAVMEYQQGGMYNQMQQFQTGGVASAYETPAPDSNVIGRSRKSLAELRRLQQSKKQYLQQGGMALPGGEMEPIPGTDAVEFAGQTHDQGGIELDPQTEVEDGETMDQVTMARGGGQRKDYFFSSHLEKGGKSFADMHKDILRNGGDQQDIDWLAKMQEHAAGRSPGKVQTAQLGGVMKYQEGGEDYLYDDDDITYTDVSPDPSQTKEQHYADLSNPPYNTNPALVTSDETRDYNKYLKSLTPQDRGAMSFEDWAASREEDKPSFKDKLKNLFKRKGKTDEELYDKAMKRNVPTGAYVAGAAQLLPAAYSFLHKQPEAQQVDYTPGFTSPIIAERGKASKLERVNYNVERARNAADMRAINKYIETSGGGPANIINKMMAYGKKQQGDAKIAAEETRANAAIANREAQLAQQMEIDNLTRSQRAATTTAQLASQEAARADQVETINAAARQKRVDDMEYMKFQGLSSAAQGISGILGDVLSYRGQERLAEIMGTEGVYDRQKVTEVFMKEINPETGKKYTRKEALDKARDLYNQYNPKDEEEDDV